MPLTLGALALACVTSPAAAEEPVREVRHDPSAYPAPATRWPLVGVGFATSLAWYGAALGGSYLYPTARGADELKIPIAGPWMSLAKTGCPETTPDCSTFWMVVGAVLKGLDGIGQAGGVFIVLEGLFLPTVQPPAKSAQLETRGSVSLDSENRRSVVVLPTAMPGGLGLGVAGLF